VLTVGSDKRFGEIYRLFSSWLKTHKQQPRILRREGEAMLERK
jgi:hypothetical protein